MLAEQVRQACVEEKLSVALIEASDAVPEDLLQYDGYVFGSPDYLGYMAGAVKTVFDRLHAFHPVIVGRPFATFATSESDNKEALHSLNDMAQAVGLRQVHHGLQWRPENHKRVTDTLIEMASALRKELDQQSQDLSP